MEFMRNPRDPSNLLFSFVAVAFLADPLVEGVLHRYFFFFASVLSVHLMMNTSSLTSLVMHLVGCSQFIRDLRAQRRSRTVDTVIGAVVLLVYSLFNGTTDVKAVEHSSLLIPLIYSHLDEPSKKVTVKRYMAYLLWVHAHLLTLSAYIAACLATIC